MGVSIKAAASGSMFEAMLEPNLGCNYKETWPAHGCNMSTVLLCYASRPVGGHVIANL